MSPGAHRALVALSNLLAFAVLACVLAYWGWRWLGPQPFVAPTPGVDDPVRVVTLSPPFGAAATPTPQQATPSVASSAEPRLLGVIAAANGRGQALFRMPDGSARLVDAGSELSSSMSLVAVRTDGVTVREAGSERVIGFRAATAAPSTTSTARRTAQGPGCAPPAGYKGPVVRLNAELVQGLVAQPEALRAIATAQDGGLVVADEAGFAAMVGLKKGDRVTQANGIALRAPEDIVVAVLRPLAASQMVRLTGSRGSEPRELVLVNAGAC